MLKVMQLYRKLMLFFITFFLFFLCILPVPVSAHDILMGGSEWNFSKTGLSATIDVYAYLLGQIQEIQSKNYDLHSCSDKQMQQITSDIIQPYMDKKLILSVNDKVYPIKILKIVKDEYDLCTISLAAEGFNLSSLTDLVKIDYELFFDETSDGHINMANIRLPEKNKVVYAFSSDASTWDSSMNNTDNMPDAVNETTSNTASTDGKIIIYVLLILLVLVAVGISLKKILKKHRVKKDSL